MVRFSTAPFSFAYLPESGKELRSAHSTSGMALVSPETEDNLRLRVALSTMFFTSDRNIIVWTNLTSEYSGSQCMWALATRSSCFSMPWSDFPAVRREKGEAELQQRKYTTRGTGISKHIRICQVRQGSRSWDARHLKIRIGRLLTGDLHHLFADLKQYSYSNVVLCHHPVQHSLWALGVSHGQLVELHRVLLHCAESGDKQQETRERRELNISSGSSGENKRNETQANHFS